MRYQNLAGEAARSHRAPSLNTAQKIAANNAILKRLAEIDKTLLVHDSALRDVYRKLQPLLAPPPEPPKPRIGFIP